jgi:hypothetical protein
LKRWLLIIIFLAPINVDKKGRNNYHINENQNMEALMRKAKMSVVISPQLVEEISSYVTERKRSQFVEQALQNELKRIKREKLIEAYRESALETEQENQFFEGATGDGIS